MAGHGILLSPHTREKAWKKPTSPFFNSQRLFTNFASKSLFETETAAMSPTSILDSRLLSGFRNPFSKNPKAPSLYEHNSWEKLDSRHIGLRIIDSLFYENSAPKSSRIVLFGSKLNIKIPPHSPPRTRAQAGSLDSSSSMPNSRKTRIFDDYAVENHSGAVSYPVSVLQSGLGGNWSTFPSPDFLSFCNYCKKNLGQGDDIYMYRGEKAFCSRECRFQEMLKEEEMEKLEPEYASCST